MTIEYTKCSQNGPNARKIDQMTTKYTNILHCKTLQIFTQIGIFGWKIYHLATLLDTRRYMVRFYQNVIMVCVTQ
jgi:hypothetical protein